jgi:hypothetical protein
MDACEEAIEVHKGMVFGITHIPADAPNGGGGKNLKDFYNSNLNLWKLTMYFIPQFIK